MKRPLSGARRVLAAIADVVALPVGLLAGRGTSEPPRSILVVEIWGLGDVVLATRALSALRQSYPAARLVLLARPHAAPLLAGSGLVDEVIAFEFPWTAPSGKYRVGRYDLHALVRVVRRLRAERFDLALDARMDPRSNLLTFLAGARRRVGFDHGGGARLLTDRVPAGPEQRHRVDDWAALLDRVGVPAADAGPTLRVTPEEQDAAVALLASHGIAPDDVVVGVHPGASAREKCWPPDRFAAVADRLVEGRRARIVAFAGPDEGADALPTRHPAVHVRPDLRRLMALLGRCDLLVCNDSGPMHVAESLGVPVVAVFGATRAEWFAPRGERHRVVAPAAGTATLGVGRAGDPSLFATIDVARVYAAAEAALDEAARGRADAPEPAPDALLAVRS